MKKVFAISLALVMALCLCACGGGGGDNDPNLGTYECTQAEMMGITMDAEEIYEDGLTLELKSGDKCVLTMDGDAVNCDWALDGDAFSLSAEGETFEGTLKDGVIELDMMGVALTFEKQ